MVTDIARRKKHHLDICLDRTANIESGSTELADIQIPHRAMPQIQLDKLSLTTDFIAYSVRLPIMISCMTGGTRDGLSLNRLLARTAGESGIPVGTGSMRIMLEHPETLDHFCMKDAAPNVPVLANIGAAQLAEYLPEIIIEAVKRTESDGLCIHLNAAQELFQDGGSVNIAGWFNSIRRLLDKAEFPVLVKETGCGIPPVEGVKLLDAGAAAVDIAGAGGTDWIAVENLQNNPKLHAAGESLRGWGISTGALLLAYRQLIRSSDVLNQKISGRIIASGGLRSPRDFALSLACGAHIAAAALPFIRAADEGGTDAVHALIDSIEKGLQAAIILSGSDSLESFRRLPLYAARNLADRANALAKEVLMPQQELEI